VENHSTIITTVVSWLLKMKRKRNLISKPRKEKSTKLTKPQWNKAVVMMVHWLSLMFSESKSNWIINSGATVIL